MISHALPPRPFAAMIAAVGMALVGSGSICAQEGDPAADPPAASGEGKKPEPVPELTEEEMNRLIDHLSSDDFTVREKAQKRLGEVTMGGDLIETMRQRFLKSANPEVKLRLRRVLYEVAKAEFLGRPKAFLGIQMQDSVFVGGKTGREMVLSVQVLSVIAGSSAEKQGVEPGDQIVSVDGKGFRAVPSTEFKSMIGALAAGDSVTLRFRRGGVERDKKVVLGEMPEDLAILNTKSEAAFDTYFLLWLDRGGKIQRP